MAFSYPYFLTLQIYENIISFLMNYYTSSKKNECVFLLNKSFNYVKLGELEINLYFSPSQVQLGKEDFL